MKSYKLIYIVAIIATLSMTCLSCHDKAATPTQEIEQLQRRMQHNLNDMQALESETLPYFFEQYLYCDSLLALQKDINPDHVVEMQILRAYLQQFENEWPGIKKHIDYSLHQLKTLKADIDGNKLNDSLIQSYLLSEKEAADLIHNQTEYFKDRLSKEKDVVDKIKKDLETNIKP